MGLCHNIKSYYDASGLATLCLDGCYSSETSFRVYLQVHDITQFKVETVIVLQIQALRFDPCQIRVKVEIIKIVT